MMAACNGHTRCIDALINYGKANKSLLDVNGNTALVYANNNGHGNNKLIKSMLSDQSSVESERFQVKGRQNSHFKPGVKENRSPVSALTSTNTDGHQESDEIFNPCQKTPFSNNNWNIDSDLNPTAEQFVPLTQHSNGWNQAKGNGYGSSNSSQSSAQSSISSVISAPTNFKRKLIGKRQTGRKSSYKSPVVAITAPMPKTLFHLLTRIDLIQYLDVFENNCIDFKQFLTLTDNDLQNLGIICYGHRKKLAIAQQRYHESLDINCTNESFLADFLLNERVVLNDKIQALEERVKDLEKK